METDTAKKHDMIDTIVAVFLDETGKLPSNTTVMELMEWSNRKMKGFSNVKKSRLPNSKNTPLSKN